MNSTTFDQILLGQKITIQDTKLAQKKFTGIGYARVSSTKQIKEGNGLDSQKRACNECAERMSIPIKGIFTDEAISGKSLERQGLYQAMEYIRKTMNTTEPITHLFMTECSRLSRSKNLYDTLDLEREIQNLGAKIVFVNMSALNNDDSGSQLLKTVSYYAASQESERISERTITGMRNRVAEGFRPFQRPLGYKSAKTILASGKEEVLMERDEPKASILAEGLEKFASGELFTKSQLFNFLKDNGVKTTCANQTCKGLVDTIVDKILHPQRLIVYAGYVTCPNRGISNLVVGKHKPLISLDTARIILDRISGKENKPLLVRKDFDERIPLRGLVFCSECGNKLTGGPSKGRHGKYYMYYNCTTRSCSQKSKSIKAEQLHKDVKDALLQRHSDEHVDNLFDHIYNEVLQDNTNTVNMHYMEKESDLRDITKEIDSIMQKIMTISNNDILKRLEDRIDELEKKKASIQEELNNKDTDTFDFTGLYEETKFLFKNADRIRELADIELRQILIGVRYNGKILYKKNQGVSNPDFCLSYALCDVFNKKFRKWGHDSVPYGTYMNIFETIQKKNSFNRMIAVVNLYVNTIAQNKEEILSGLSDKEKVLYEL